MAKKTKLIHNNVNLEIQTPTNFTNNGGFITQYKYEDDYVPVPGEGNPDVKIITDGTASQFIKDHAAKLLNCIEIDWGNAISYVGANGYPDKIKTSVDLLQYIFALKNELGNIAQKTDIPPQIIGNITPIQNTLYNVTFVSSKTGNVSVNVSDGGVAYYDRRQLNNNGKIWSQANVQYIITVKNGNAPLVPQDPNIDLIDLTQVSTVLNENKFRIKSKSANALTISRSNEDDNDVEFKCGNQTGKTLSNIQLSYLSVENQVTYYGSPDITVINKLNTARDINIKASQTISGEYTFIKPTITLTLDSKPSVSVKLINPRQLRSEAPGSETFTVTRTRNVGGAQYYYVGPNVINSDNYRNFATNDMPSTYTNEGITGPIYFLYPANKNIVIEDAHMGFTTDIYNDDVVIDGHKVCHINRMLHGGQIKITLTDIQNDN